MARRKEHDVVNLYATFDPAEFESSKRFYPRWTGRRDKVLQLVPAKFRNNRTIIVQFLAWPSCLCIPSRLAQRPDA